MGSLQQTISDDRVRHLVQVLHEALHTRRDKRRVDALVFAVHQARDVRQRSVPASVPERFEHRPVSRPVSKQDLDELHQDELFAGDGHVGADIRVAANLEQIPRFVDRLGAADHDERAIRDAAGTGIGGQPVRALGMDLHARNEQHLDRLAVEPREARAEVRAPLLQDNPGLGQPRIVQRGPHGTGTRRSHPVTAEEVGQQTCSLVERIDHNRRYAQPRRRRPDSLT